MDKAVFTEVMTPEEFKAKTVEVSYWPRAAQEEAAPSFINVLESKILSGEWQIVDVQNRGSARNATWRQAPPKFLGTCWPAADGCSPLSGLLPKIFPGSGGLVFF